jgi:hypothetical protein
VLVQRELEKRPCSPSQAVIEKNGNGLIAFGPIPGCGGPVSLTWVETAPSEDNFVPLTARAWQVHVYGEPQRGLADACAELGLPLHLVA